MSETVTPLAALQQHLTEKFPEYANLLAEFPPRERIIWLFPAISEANWVLTAGIGIRIKTARPSLGIPITVLWVDTVSAERFRRI